MNDEAIRSEAELIHALRKVLDNSIFRMAVVVPKTAGHRPDLSVTVTYEGHSAAFVASCKLNPTASGLDEVKASAGGKKHALLITVRLSESLVDQCRQRGVSCLDLNGRVWIKTPTLLIDRSPPASALRYRLATPDLRFFSPKSTRLPRALLHSPDRTWRQSDLAGATGISQGLLSRLLNHASRQGWVAGRRGDWKLANPVALLDAWEREDDFNKRVSLRQYSTLEIDLRDIARRLTDQTDGEVAFTQWFAASLRLPYSDVHIVTVYRREFPTDDEQRALNCREVVDGGRIWIAVPRDEGVFKSIQRADGLPLVSDAQIYLDLIHAGLRGPEQARALREWKGFCKP